jgi:probable rRNA maturation factor
MASMMSETDQDPGAVLEVEVSRSVEPLDEEPDQRDVTDWLKKAYSKLGKQRSEVSVRVVSTEEISNLNQTYRGNPSPTNVLSFPADLESEQGVTLLGDIVICSQVVLAESREYEKSFGDRYAHMVVHGMLHLMGYDHQEDAERVEMESLEVELLGYLGISNPYEMEPS